MAEAGLTIPAEPPLSEWATDFLKILRGTGNLARACQVAGISRRRALDAKDENKSFATEWDDALADHADFFEEEVFGHVRAHGTASLYAFLLKGKKPSIYGTRTAAEIRAVKEQFGPGIADDEDPPRIDRGRAE